MSPEQLRVDLVDARSDIFSFGCVLYELLCGRRPFVASTDVDVAFAILHREPEPLPKATPDRISTAVQLVSLRKRTRYGGSSAVEGACRA